MKAKDSRAQFNMQIGLENKTEQGTIKLQEGVIASVVKNATCSIAGVIRLASSGLTESIANIFGARKKSEGAIKINFSNEQATVEIKIIVEYGVNIPDLAINVQKAVIKEIKKITGIIVSQVNVIIQGIEGATEKESEIVSREDVAVTQPK